MAPGCSVVAAWVGAKFSCAAGLGGTPTIASCWMAIGEPLLAYLGRRLEYQADRFYLRNGGTLAEMTEALQELSARNLARTDDLRIR